MMICGGYTLATSKEDSSPRMKNILRRQSGEQHERTVDTLLRVPAGGIGDHRTTKFWLPPKADIAKVRAFLA